MKTHLPLETLLSRGYFKVKKKKIDLDRCTSMSTSLSMHQINPKTSKDNGMTILSLRGAVWGPKPFRFPCVPSLVLRGRGVARLGPGRGHMGTEEQGLHGAARTGPRVSESEIKWDQGPRGWGEAEKEATGKAGGDWGGSLWGRRAGEVGGRKGERGGRPDLTCTR